MRIYCFAPQETISDMFTGIILGLGEVTEVIRASGERRFTISPLFEKDSWEDGESISINGVCLSVEKHWGKIFQVYASAETLAASNLGALETGDKVNLEPALALGEKLGGHLVSGHVDCVATVSRISRRGESREMRFGFPASFGAEVVRKGSVALNGISLTVNQCGSDFLNVNVIPDSLARTNISQWRIGSRINMETDIIGKYVLKAISTGVAKGNSMLSRDFLDENGFY